MCRFGTLVATMVLYTVLLFLGEVILLRIRPAWLNLELVVGRTALVPAALLLPFVIRWRKLGLRSLSRIGFSLLLIVLANVPSVIGLWMLEGLQSAEKVSLDQFPVLSAIVSVLVAGLPGSQRGSCPAGGPRA